MTTKQYNAIVEEYNIRIFRFLMKNMSDREISKDLLQETFLKLWEFKDRINIDSMKSWLFTTAYHAMLKQFTQKERFVMKDATEIERPAVADQEFENKQFFEHYLPLLPPIQRSILVLRDLEGYNYKEIGDMLNIPETQVKVYLFRARQKLRDMMESKEAKQ